MTSNFNFKDILSKPKNTRTPEEQEFLNGEMLRITGGKANNLMNGVGAFGNILQATSTMPGQEPNVGQSAMGGALSGLSSGMAFGPIGAILGAGIGGVTGFMGGSKNLEEHLLQLNQEQESNIASKTIQPTTYKSGGMIGQSGIQAELGEVVFLPELLELVSVAAKKKHSEMDSKLITDFFPKGAVVLSNKTKFDPKKIEDRVLGYGQGHYEENKTYAPEQIKVGNIFGDEELTYAEAANKLKKSISVTDGKKKDIFDDITDAENKITRMMYLQELINSQEDIDTDTEESSVPKFEYGGPVGEGVSQDYYANVLKKLQELRNTNQSELDRGKEDLNSLSKKLRGSIVAQAGVSSLFTALQNPRTTPVIQDNTFIEDSYQQIPQSLIESQVSPIRGSVNSLAQMLLSSGADPGQVPAMLASSQGRALDAEGRMRSGFIQDRVNADRGKFQALRNNLTTNKSNIVAAENATTEGFNQRFAQFGSILNNMMGQGRELTAGKYEAGRNLDKSFLDNDINLFQTEADIAGNQMQFDDSMSRVNERLAQLRAESGRLNAQIDRRNMYTTQSGVDENGHTVTREVPKPMDLMSLLPMLGIKIPKSNRPMPGDPGSYHNPFPWDGVR